MLFRTNYVLALALAAGTAGCSKAHPEFSWLYFGHEGKARILVRLDNEAVTLTHYLLNQPTGGEVRFAHRSYCKDVHVNDPAADPATKYTITHMSGSVAKAGQPTNLCVEVSIDGPLTYRQYCDVPEMSDNIAQAPISRFHAPLTVQAQTVNWKLPSDLVLRRGENPSELRAVVGTMDADSSCWVVVRTETEDKSQPMFSWDTHPFVDVEFPPRQPQDASLIRRYPLDRICCGCVFHGPVEAPEAAGSGRARLTFSFDAWQGANVSSNTVEIPIADSGQAVK